MQKYRQNVPVRVFVFNFFSGGGLTLTALLYFDHHPTQLNDVINVRTPSSEQLPAMAEITTQRRRHRLITVVSDCTYLSGLYSVITSENASPSDVIFVVASDRFGGDRFHFALDEARRRVGQRLAVTVGSAVRHRYRCVEGVPARRPSISAAAAAGAGAGTAASAAHDGAVLRSAVQHAKEDVAELLADEAVDGEVHRRVGDEQHVGDAVRVEYDVDVELDVVSAALAEAGGGDGETEAQVRQTE